MIKKSTIILLIYVFSPCLFAQQINKPFIDYVKNINQFNQLDSQEKVYLHFDNTGYYIGETIWFKAYVVNATHNGTTFLSKVLYVELLTPQGEIVDRRKLKIENGQCHGEFRLASKYRSGFYEVRAYTRCMLNFGEECMFSRVLPVYSDTEIAGDYTDKKLDDPTVLTNFRKKTEENSQINLSFYPEGGNAVMGLRSRIAFKATGKEGQDLDITGTVYNAKREAIATFSTIHQGMGFFELTPEYSEYKIVVEHQKKQQTFTFNQIQLSGYVMQIDHLTDTTLQIQLNKSATLPNDTVALSVSCRGTVYVAKTFRITNTPYAFLLCNTNLPCGCLQFTLFNRQGDILAERLAFNSGQLDYLTVGTDQPQTTYKPLEQTQMEINVRNKSGFPVSTTFSLSIRNADTEILTNYQDNILTNLLLSSDIKGYVKNPMQYFTGPDRKTRAKLDMLMMVQGWRRYNWQMMTGITPFQVKYYAEEGLDISGKVLEWNKNIAKSGATISYLMTKDSISFHGRCKTDKSGQFYFPLPDSTAIKGKWLLGLQVNIGKEREPCRILLDRSGPQGRAYSYYDTFVCDSLVVFEKRMDSLQRTSITEMQYLEEVIVKKESIKPDIILDVEKEINLLKDKGENYPKTIREYLNNRVTEIKDTRKCKYAGRTTYICYDYNRPETSKKVGNDKANILSWSIEDVYKIDVYYRNKAAWTQYKGTHCYLRAPHKSAVFILVYLYDNGLHDAYQDGIRQTFYDGYSQTKEFYHMDNSKKQPGEVDFRRTLYWNPNVKTDEEGKAKISFYNNSTCKRMSISAEGITEDGVFIITPK